jgi:hypothetical protein
MHERRIFAIGGTVRHVRIPAWSRLDSDERSDAQ